MKALSIRQPWAWLILNAGKDIENRNWSTRYRGTVLVHAGKRFDQDGYLWAMANTDIGLRMPGIFEFENEEGFLGGIVGAVDIVDCVQQSASPWFCGPNGFVLANPQPLLFQPCRGALGFFEPRIEATP